MRPVVDLLVEQIECADYIILNKIDQLDAAQLESLKGIASSLNPLSRVCLAVSHMHRPAVPPLSIPFSGMHHRLACNADHPASQQCTRCTTGSSRVCFCFRVCTQCCLES